MSTFTDVPWANADTITEQKLDDMVNNDKYVRDDATTEPVALHLPAETLVTPASGIIAVGLEFKIGALTLTTATTTSTSFVDLTSSKNFDVSSLSKRTIQTLELYTKVSGGSSLFQWEQPVYIHRDCNFLSAWAKIRKVDANNLQIRGLVVLRSRINEGFTP